LVAVHDHPAPTLLITGAVSHPMEIVQRQGPLRSLLNLAQPAAAADHATVASSDGQYRASIPTEWLLRGSLEAGRLRIAGAPTKCWNVKDVVSIELTEGSRPDSVRPESFTNCVPDS
jgi:hypothetical protein